MDVASVRVTELGASPVPNIDKVWHANKVQVTTWFLNQSLFRRTATGSEPFYTTLIPFFRNQN
jgi:hypothetical protein